MRSLETISSNNVEVKNIKACNNGMADNLSGITQYSMEVPAWPEFETTFDKKEKITLEPTIIKSKRNLLNIGNMQIWP